MSIEDKGTEQMSNGKPNGTLRVVIACGQDRRADMRPRVSGLLLQLHLEQSRCADMRPRISGMLLHLHLEQLSLNERF